MNIINFIKNRVLNTTLFKGRDGIPFSIKGHFIPAKESTKVCLIVGPNGSGKSLVRRIIHSIFSGKKGYRFIDISQEGRSQYMSTLKYGLEEIHPTGLNSFHVADKIFRQKAGDAKMVLFLDEPELGMADETAAGCGKHIAQLVNSSTDDIEMVFIVCHNRYFVKELLKHISVHFLQTGNSPYSSLTDWLDRSIVPVDLASLETQALDTKHKTLDLLKD